MTQRKRCFGLGDLVWIKAGMEEEFDEVQKELIQHLEQNLSKPGEQMMKDVAEQLRQVREFARPVLPSMTDEELTIDSYFLLAKCTDLSTAQLYLSGKSSLMKALLEVPEDHVAKAKTMAP